jgi:5-formyltetrahydrofolate cyclo-ligase
MTDEIFEEARRRGVAAVYPKVENGGNLSFRKIDRLDQMKPGAWEIFEPPPTSPVLPLSEADLVIVPGVAFDRRGRRLGQGGGYYDKILNQMRPTAVRMGIAYELQVVDEIPHEPHDEMMDCLATESGILRFRNSGGEPC